MKLLQYIQGERKGKEARRIELEAMKDPFLAESLEGYDAVEGMHAETVAELRKKITARTKKRNSFWLTAGAAASLIFCIGFGGYFLLHSDKKPFEKEIARVHDEIPADTLMTPVPDKLVAPQAFSEEAVQPLAEVGNPACELHSEARGGASYAKKESLVAEIAETTLLLCEEGAGEYEEERVLSDVAENDKAEDEVELITGEVLAMPTEVYPKATIAAGSSISRNSENQEVSGDSATRLSGNDTCRITEPSPKIGMKAYRKYIEKNLRYPENAACTGITGEVELEFSIDRHGKPVFVHVRKSLCAAFDEEALRIVKEGPEWIPGQGTVKLKIEF